MIDAFSPAVAVIMCETFSNQQLEGLKKSARLQHAGRKETTLERTDFTLRLMMFVTGEKERENVYNFLSLQFLSAAVPTNLN